MKVFLFMIFTFSLIMNPLQAQKVDTIFLSKTQSQVIKRKLEIISQDKNSFLKFSEEKSEGLLVLEEEKFNTGEIIVKMRGKDVFQRSFIGIAFNIKNDSTFEAVYCRPFNFLSTDSVRRIHAVQYISHPKYTWEFLRGNKNATFEKEIKSPPNPNDWFELRLKITKNDVLAYINDQIEPCLKIKRLTKPNSKKIGLFMGDSSGGDFEYLIIKKY